MRVHARTHTLWESLALQRQRQRRQRVVGCAAKAATSSKKKAHPILSQGDQLTAVARARSINFSPNRLIAAFDSLESEEDSIDGFQYIQANARRGPTSHVDSLAIISDGAPSSLCIPASLLIPTTPNHNHRRVRAGVDVHLATTGARRAGKRWAAEEEP